MNTQFIPDILEISKQRGCSYIQVINYEIQRYKLNSEISDNVQIEFNKLKYLDIYAKSNIGECNLMVAITGNEESQDIADFIMRNMLNLPANSKNEYRSNDYDIVAQEITNEKYKIDILNTKELEAWFLSQLKQISTDFEVSPMQTMYTIEIVNQILYSSKTDPIQYTTENYQFVSMLKINGKLSSMIPFGTSILKPFGDVKSIMREQQLSEKISCFTTEAEQQKNLTGIFKFSHDIMVYITNILSYLFNIELLMNDMSFLNSTNIGEKKFGSHINLLDVPIPNNKECNHYIFDAEGIQTRTKNLIENGILKDYLGDLFNSQRFNLNCTGNSSLRFPNYSNKTIEPTNLMWKIENKINEIEVEQEILMFGMDVAFDITTGFIFGTAYGFSHVNNEKKYEKYFLNIQIQDILNNIVHAKNYVWHGNKYLPEVIIDLQGGK